MSNIPEIYLAMIAILAGFAGLVWSADRFVAGAAAMAKNFGVAPVVIGLTIVSFGTSAPEILVSLNAALTGEGSIAIGNAVGSNIANIGLVLGCTAMIARIPVQTHILKDELPILLGVTAVAGFLLFDAKLEPYEGWILALLLPPSMAWLVYRKKKDISPEEAALEVEEVPDMSTFFALLWFAIGLGILVASSKILVWGATFTATHFEVSPLIIGLTVLAIGTSLPELAASIMSALKGHHDIALGNIIGSNIFNLLAVMSIPGIIDPLSTDKEVFFRDYATMAGLTVFLAAVALISLMRRGPSKPGFGRIAGLLMLVSYGAYLSLLF